MVDVSKKPLSTPEIQRIRDWATAPDAARARRVISHRMAGLFCELSREAMIAEDENRRPEMIQVTSKIRELQNFLSVLDWLKHPDEDPYTVDISVIEE